MSAGDLPECVEVDARRCEGHAPFKLDLDVDPEEDEGHMWPVEVVMNDDAEATGGGKTAGHATCSDDNYPLDQTVGVDQQVNRASEHRTALEDERCEGPSSDDSKAFPAECIVAEMQGEPDCLVDSHFLMQESTHEQGQDKLALRPYTCEMCGKSFARNIFLTKHYSSHAVNKCEKVHDCKLCDKTFIYRSSLRKHILTHSDKQPFSCQECGKGFMRRSSVVQHSRIHTGERPHKCDHCSKAFVDRASLVIHMRVHTRERPFSCELCGKTFGYRTSHVRHMRSHAGLRPYVCDLCGCTFKGRSGLKYHRALHLGQRPFACQVCGKTFTDKSGLYGHVRTHSNERPYSCDNCGKSFKNRQGVLRHFNGMQPGCKEGKK